MTRPIRFERWKWTNWSDFASRFYHATQAPKITFILFGSDWACWPRGGYCVASCSNVMKRPIPIIIPTKLVFWRVFSTQHATTEGWWWTLPVWSVTCQKQQQQQQQNIVVFLEWEGRKSLSLSLIPSRDANARPALTYLCESPCPTNHAW